jgi:hypothetical protein
MTAPWATAQGLGRALAKHLTKQTGELALLKKAMRDGDILDQNRTPTRQLGMHITEPLMAMKGYRADAMHVVEGVKQGSPRRRALSPRLLRRSCRR